MLIDPENTGEWEDTVQASSLDEARSKCEAIAENEELVKVMNVTQLTQRPSKQGQYKFIYWFRAEGKDHDTDTQLKMGFVR